MDLDLTNQPNQAEVDYARELWAKVYLPQVPMAPSPRVRFPRVTRDRFAEAEFGPPYSVFTHGLRKTAIDDDRAFWSILQDKIADFSNGIKQLRVKSGNKLGIEVRYLPPFGRPRLTLRWPDGKLAKIIDSQHLGNAGIRGAAMPLRRCLEIEAELHQLEKQLLKAIKATPKIHSELLDVAYRRGRIGGGPLGLTDSIFNQINKLRVFRGEQEPEGYWCPLPFNAFEHLRTHTLATTCAITSHLLTMNHLYNTKIGKGGARYRKQGSMFLRTEASYSLNFPRFIWLRSMLASNGKHLKYPMVMRSIYTKASGWLTLEKTVPVMTPSGTLNPQAVAYAGLSPMWDLYRWVDLRAIEIKALCDNQIALFRPILLGRDKPFLGVGNWDDTARRIHPDDLHILCQ